MSFAFGAAPSARRPIGRFVRLATLGVLVACGAEQTSPTAPVVAAGDVASEDRTPVGFPDVTGSARIYLFDELAPPGLEGYDDRDGSSLSAARASRFVLFDDGHFALQYSDTGVELLGSYTEVNGSLALRWDANATMPAEYPFPPEMWPGPWEATGVLSGQTLVLSYNFVMWLDGFLNGVYVQVP